MAKEDFTCRFTCIIEDFYDHTRYFAEVTFKKKKELRTTWREVEAERTSSQKNRIELADIFITPMADNLRNFHHHFVLYKYTGDGVFIRRGPYLNSEEVRLECKIWDLGHSFATQVMETLRSIA